MLNRKVAKILISVRHFRCRASRILKQCVKPLISHKKQLTIASLVSTILLITNYIVDSLPIPIGGEVTVAQWMDKLGRILGSNSDNIPDSICLINVAYDKALVDYEAKCFSSKNDTSRQFAGQITTTDRRKLLQFLTFADSLKNYKYILLDVRFEDDIKSDSTTDSLFNLIKKMDKVVYAVHINTETAQNAPLDKSAYGDYYTTFLVSDIVKYPIIQQDSSLIKYSIPTKIYCDLYGHRLSYFGLFAFDNGSLCKSSIYPTFPVKLTSWMVKSDNSVLPTPQYYNLGADLLDSYDPALVISPLIENKIVVIGDFNEDLHDAFIGQQPGAIVNLNAYVALCSGKHIIKWIEIFLTFTVFFLISWLILRQRQLLHYIPILRRSRSSFVKFVVTFIGFSVILTLYAILIYFIFDSVFSVVYPSLYFTIFELCVKSIK